MKLFGVEFRTCRNPRYYDLVTVPHGHIPAPIIKRGLWSWVPLPLKGQRDEYTYYCPQCGEPSFFKIYGACWRCQDFYSWKDLSAFRKLDLVREKKKRFWKKIEYWFLPVLALLGKASYMPSTRIHYIHDFTFEQRREMEVSLLKALEQAEQEEWEYAEKEREYDELEGFRTLFKMEAS